MAKGFAAFIGKESRMKIQSSSIMMTSSHQETSYTHKESATIEVAKSKDAAAAILSISTALLELVGKGLDNFSILFGVYLIASILTMNGVIA